MFGGNDKNIVMLGGLSELMNRLGQIEESCLGTRQGADDGGGPDKSDKFLQLKYFITQDLTEYKMKIHDRFQLQKTAGASVEVISLSAQIRHLDGELTKNLEKLKEVYRKQCDGSFFIFSRSNTDQKELSERYAQLSNIAAQVEEARKAWRTNQDADTGESPTNNARSKVLGSKAKSSIEEKPKQKVLRQGELDEHEKEALDRWKEADQKLDVEIDEVGHVVDRLRPIADEIGLQSQKQEKMLAMIKTRAERASQGIRQVSIRLRQIVDTERKSTFACRVVLVLVLLGLGIWIYERSKNKFSR